MGFTLVELLVAMAIGMVVVALALSITTNAVERLSVSGDRLQTEAVARFALNRISEDIESLVALPKPTQWLCLRDGTAGPPGFSAVKADELMFYTCATDRPGKNSGDGEISAAFYGLRYQGLQAGSSKPFFALYRAVIEAPETFQEGAGKSDLAALWDTDGAFSGRASARESMLAQNVIGFRVLLNFRRPDGTLESIDAPAALGEVWSSGRWTSGIGAAGELLSVEAQLTLLTRKGETMRQNGALSKQELVQRYGYSYSRLIPVYSKPRR